MPQPTDAEDRGSGAGSGVPQPTEDRAGGLPTATARLAMGEPTATARVGIGEPTATDARCGGTV